MSYMWENFNIKTFPAETIVYRDGLFCPELSTLKNTYIDKNYDLPVHIIYVGEITDKNELDVNISAQNQKVFLSMKIKNKKPAFLNIFIKNTGKKSDFRAHIMLENNNDLIFNCTSEHSESETTGLIKVKLLAGKESKSKLSGTAIINKNCLKTQSDISFSAIADKSARIEFMPAQKISALRGPACIGPDNVAPSGGLCFAVRGTILGGAARPAADVCTGRDTGEKPNHPAVGRPASL